MKNNHENNEQRWKLKVKTKREFTTWVCSLVSNSFLLSCFCLFDVVHCAILWSFLWLCLICICHSKWWFVYVEYVRVCVVCVFVDRCVSPLCAWWFWRCTLINKMCCTQKCCIVECHTRNRTAQLDALVAQNCLIFRSWLNFKSFFLTIWKIFFQYFDKFYASTEFPKWTGAHCK